MSPADVSGFVLVDKPAGWTSHDVVAKLRRVLGQRRVGHAGTLDPMATGVLILAVGRATRLLSLASDADKTYTATIRLGQVTSSDDADSPVERSVDARGLTAADVTAAMAEFVGTIDQRPSAVSAIKVAGQRAYQRVRAGEAVVLPSRKVDVWQFELLDLDPHGECLDARVVVRCGSGTYVRALARDLGETLGVGGHLTALRRVTSSGVDVAECQSIDQMIADPRVRPPVELVSRWCPLVPVPDPAPLSHGRSLTLPAQVEVAEDATVAVVSSERAMVALATVRHGMLEPSVVLIDPIRGTGEHT